MPIKFWVWSFLLTIILLLSIQWVFNYRNENVLLQKNKITEFGNQSNDKTGKLDIYFIGSSLTRAALFQSGMFDYWLHEKKMEINYKAMIEGSSSLDDFVTIIKEVKSINPRCLFIEADLACLNKYSNFRGRMVLIPQNIIKTIGDSFVSKFNNRNAAKIKSEMENIDQANGVLFDVYSLDEFPEWNEFYAEAEKMGIQIYLLDIPRSAEADGFLPDNIKEGYQKLLIQYEEKYNIHYIHFPDALSRDRYYIDRAHFNLNGSELYSRWFVDKLSEMGIVKSK